MSDTSLKPPNDILWLQELRRRIAAIIDHAANNIVIGPELKKLIEDCNNLLDWITQTTRNLSSPGNTSLQSSPNSIADSNANANSNSNPTPTPNCNFNNNKPLQSISDSSNSNLIQEKSPREQVPAVSPSSQEILQPTPLPWRSTSPLEPRSNPVSTVTFSQYQQIFSRHSDPNNVVLHKTTKLVGPDWRDDNVSRAPSANQWIGFAKPSGAMPIRATFRLGGVRDPNYLNSLLQKQQQTPGHPKRQHYINFDEANNFNNVSSSTPGPSLPKRQHYINYVDDPNELLGLTPANSSSPSNPPKRQHYIDLSEGTEQKNSTVSTSTTATTATTASSLSSAAAAAVLSDEYSNRQNYINIEDIDDSPAASSASSSVASNTSSFSSSSSPSVPLGRGQSPRVTAEELKFPSVVAKASGAEFSGAAPSGALSPRKQAPTSKRGANIYDTPEPTALPKVSTKRGQTNYAPIPDKEPPTRGNTTYYSSLTGESEANSSNSATRGAPNTVYYSASEVPAISSSNSATNHSNQEPSRSPFVYTRVDENQSVSAGSEPARAPNVYTRVDVPSGSSSSGLAPSSPGPSSDNQPRRNEVVYTVTGGKRMQLPPVAKAKNFHPMPHPPPLKRSLPPINPGKFQNILTNPPSGPPNKPLPVPPARAKADEIYKSTNSAQVTLQLSAPPITRNVASTRPTPNPSPFLPNSPNAANKNVDPINNKNMTPGTAANAATSAIPTRGPVTYTSTQ
jgi:hypothetical protein